ncbi:CoA transferase [Yinghuangia sp. ASG 101]|uniref:CaiB/BaiF CoA transferase family protein n=1 Tax=Yinghuangia sp. ASG 101 TaxID=2896848 RepID=UPI001E2EFDB2|nr:CaiB/BaiF CoA-transferase family protein [Yinghuangia sp. ASG 101]UGQ11180.1 CoA transferase [Yinghuangia sp. ASG 101]
MGPLAGVRVLELAGLGPVPFAAMMLSDLGAEVIRVDRADRAGATRGSGYIMNRGRRSVAVDIKNPRGREVILRLAENCDALLEGFRPGTMERLGLGPDTCLERNPRLVFGRMTGWGQSGPLAHTAGHDLTYLALSGTLSNFARPGTTPVTPPAGMVADLGGGGLMLAFGVVSGVLEARGSGRGQVVDAAMIDGVTAFTVMLRSMMAEGRWTDAPGSNFSDGGSHYYNVYDTADGGHVAVAAVEPPFYAALLEGLGLDRARLPHQNDSDRWPEMKKLFADIFRGRTRDDWERHFDGTDACVAPVLSLTEAVDHPHSKARKTFIEHAGAVQPAPAPRFDRTPGNVTLPPRRPGADTDAVLDAAGFSGQEISTLRSEGVVG